MIIPEIVSIEEYTIGDYNVKIDRQSTSPHTSELDGWGFSVSHIPSGRLWAAGAYDLAEVVYHKILTIIDEHTKQMHMARSYIDRNGEEKDG